jgi:endoglucanase
VSGALRSLVLAGALAIAGAGAASPDLALAEPGAATAAVKTAVNPTCRVAASRVSGTKLRRRLVMHLRMARRNKALAGWHRKAARRALRRARRYNRRGLRRLARRQFGVFRKHARAGRRRSRLSRRHLGWWRWYSHRTRATTCRPASGTPAQGLPGSEGNPFRGQNLFIDPDSNAVRTERAWRSTRPADADQMRKIATQSQADWFVSKQGETWWRKRLEQIYAAQALPVLALYDIPNRDCGSYNSGVGESANAAAYHAWIDKIIGLIGGRRAVIILEPDALPQALEDWCLSAEQRQGRIAILRETARNLGRHPNIATYMDAGQPHWHGADEMAPALRAAGIEYIRGFSVNVSNFQTTANMIRFGNEISVATGGKHYVVDTSRNGRGPAPGDEWCNPPGRGLGERPTTNTASPAADAYLWIKRPGDTDGPCNGYPAFSFSAEYALGLAQRSVP